MGPGFRRDDEGVEPSHRRQQFVAAIIGVEFSAALLADRGNAQLRLSALLAGLPAAKAALVAVMQNTRSAAAIISIVNLMARSLQ
jgi:hypothetical protein